MKYSILITIFIIGLTLISLLSTSNQFVMDAATFDSSLIPGADNIYDIGFESSPKWKDAAFSGNLTTTGDVGIGTTTPSEKLTVVDGNINQNISSFNPILQSKILPPMIVNIRSNYISGQYAYYGIESRSGACDSSTSTGCEFLIYDVSSPANPAYMGGANMGRNVYAIFISGRYAYIGRSTGSGNEFLIYDISNPSSPSYVGGSDSFSTVSPIFVSGKYAYIGTFNNASGNEFQIFDISNPANPAYVGGAEYGNSIYYLYISGKYAYLGGVNGLFQIFDISNPANPAYVGGADVGSAINAVFISGRYSYIGRNSASGNEFLIYDISNPSSPSYVGGSEIGLNINAVFVSGKYAYIGTFNNASGNEFQIFDISNPANPAYIGGIDTGIGIGNVSIAGKYAYIDQYAYPGSCTSCESLIYDISGLETVSANIHSLEAGNLQVRNDIIAQGQLQVSGGINVGTGGIFSAGPIGVSIASTTQTDAVSAYFQGRVGIATTTPMQKLEINGGIKIFSVTTTSETSHCNATSTRGTLWFVTSSTKDQFLVCAKNSSDEYDWRKLF